ncbi:MAG TPA: hypothetical protein VGB54_12495 [Allosphingosinicella sp.]|jgi:hypothetical protein
MMIDHSVSPLLPGRREAIGSFLSAFVLVALVREARAAPVRAEGGARRWIAGQAEIADGLASGRLTGLQWAREVERLAAEVDVAELMALVRRSRIDPAGPAAHNDPSKRYVRFLDEAGGVRRLGYGAALFDFSPTNVITPHGHRHMVSAHLVVQGALRVRNFDRVGDEGEAMRLRPTRDYVARVGQVSTMCSERDNIHWFVPQGGPAATFDVVVSGLEPGAPDHVIQAVDPLRAAPAADGTLLAPIIGFGESSARYTANI